MATLECLFSVLGSVKYTYAIRIISKESSLLLKGSTYLTRALIVKSSSVPRTLISGRGGYSSLGSFW